MQPGLSLTRSQTPEDRLSRDVAHFHKDSKHLDSKIWVKQEQSDQGLHCLYFHLHLLDTSLFELGDEKMCLMSYANNKGADQPAHPHSLISAFIVHCLDSVISLVSVIKISNLKLASVAEQAGLSVTWSETPEDTFSHDEAHMLQPNCPNFSITTTCFMMSKF